MSSEILRKNHNMELKERILKAIEYSNLTQSQVEKALNLRQHSISEMVRGVVKNPKLRVLVELAKITKVDLRWLVTGEGRMVEQEPIRYKEEDLVMVPILGRIPAGNPSYAEEVRDGSVPALKSDVPEDAFALKVDGESMVPELENGDIVIVVPVQLEELRGKGEMVAVRIHTDTLIKRFYKNEKEIRLVSTNPNYQSKFINPCDIGFLGRVIMKIKKYKE